MKTALGFGRQRHKTLVDCFGYPTGGSGMVCDRMAQYVSSHGGKVHLGCPVRRVLTDQQDLHLTGEEGRLTHSSRRVRGLELADGRRLAFDHVVSTMPLTLLVKGMEGVPAEVISAADALAYRNTVLVYLNVEGTDLFSDQWLYIHSPDLLMGRVTNFRNWVPELYGAAPTTILALEYWCYDQDELWREPDAQLIERAAREMAATGLIARRAVLAGHVVRLHRSYPVYGRGYKEPLARVVSFLRGCRGLTPIGRYGAFKYNNQDHSILMGLLAAENLLRGGRHDLWTVNSDDEYQESAPVEETRRAA
jgi:protoporphyrinogen oxidase